MTTDPWFLPTRQRELPFREMLPAARLHARREGTFLVLAGTFLIATAAMLLLPARVLDLSASIAEWTGMTPPADLHVLVGALAFPITLVMLVLVGELYGSRRALALVTFGAISCLALAGVVRAANPDGFGFALSFTAFYLAAHVGALAVCAAMARKRRWLRANLAAVVAQLVGWSAFGTVWYLFATKAGDSTQAAFDQVAALVLGAGASATAVVLAATLPLAIAAHTLTIYLRVGVTDDEPDEAVEPEVVALVKPAVKQPVLAEGSQRKTPPPPPPAQRLANPWHPDTSAERRFFTEGDQLDESAPDLPAARN